MRLGLRGSRAHVAVVGGGISGLAAADRLLAGPEPPRVTLLEAAGRTGGLAETGILGGRPVDLGPDSLVMRSPQLVELVEDLGLGGSLIEPAHGETAVWSRGRPRPLPLGVTAGLPGGFGSLLRSGLLSPAGAARAALDFVLPRTPPEAVGDSIGRLLRRRLGDEVLERVMDPLLGGIHHGSCDELSLRIAGPQFAAAAAGPHRSLIRGLRAQARTGTGATSMFAAPPGGVAELTDALAARIASRGGHIRTGARVRELRGDRAALEGGGEVGFDAAVLAMGPEPSAAVLGGAAPRSAAGLATLPTASLSLALLVYPPEADAVLPPGNGLLIPYAEGGLVRAATWVTRKWPQRGGDGSAVVRCSLPTVDGLGDEALASAAHADLAARLGRLPPPLSHRVVRLPRALAVARPGHPERIAAIRSGLAAELPTVRLAGPHISGSGLGACIATAQTAAESLLPTA